MSCLVAEELELVGERGALRARGVVDDERRVGRVHPGAVRGSVRARGGDEAVDDEAGAVEGDGARAAAQADDVGARGDAGGRERAPSARGTRRRRGPRWPARRGGPSPRARRRPRRPADSRRPPPFPGSRGRGGPPPSRRRARARARRSASPGSTGAAGSTVRMADALARTTSPFVDLEPDGVAARPAARPPRRPSPPRCRPPGATGAPARSRRWPARSCPRAAGAAGPSRRRAPRSCSGSPRSGRARPALPSVTTSGCGRTRASTAGRARWRTAARRWPRAPSRRWRGRAPGRRTAPPASSRCSSRARSDALLPHSSDTGPLVEERHLAAGRVLDGGPRDAR